MRAATEAYREEMDPLFGFRDCCTFEPTAWTSTAGIRSALEAVGAEEHVRDLPDHNELAALLTKLGCVARKAWRASAAGAASASRVPAVQSFGEE